MAILDAYGRPIRTGQLRQSIAGARPMGLRNIYSTATVRGTTPATLASILRQAEYGTPERYLDLAEEMEERDLHYLAVLGTRKRQVSQLQVTVEPAEDTPEAQANADLVQDWLDSTEIEDEIFHLMDAVAKGFSVLEIIWDLSAREWMPARLKYRLPRWFQYDLDSGEMLQLRDDAGRQGYVPLEPAKFIVHRPLVKSGMPIRGGLARCAAWAWMFKNYSIRDWVSFNQTYGMPLRVGKYDRSATQAERDVLLEAVHNIAADAAAIIPENMMIEFVTAQSGSGSGSGGAGAYAQLAAYMDAQVSKAVLGQTLTTEQGDSGSYSLGQVHDEVRSDIERSDARQLAATLNRDLVRPLILLNRGEGELARMPRIMIGREEQVDVTIMSNALAQLLPHGLRVSAADVRQKMGLAEPEGDDDVLAAPAPPPILRAEGATDATDETAEPTRALATAPDRDPVQQAVDALFEDAGWQPLMDPIIEPILAEAEAVLAEGGNMDTLRARMPELFAKMDDAALVRTLRQMGFSAHISGQIDG